MTPWNTKERRVWALIIGLSIFLPIVVLGGLALELDARTDTPPVLTEVQRLQVLNAAKDVELWQLKAQQAASEFEKAQAALAKLIATVTPSGYRLNEKLELVKVERDAK